MKKATNLDPGNLCMDDEGIYFILERFEARGRFLVLDFGPWSGVKTWTDSLCFADDLLTEPEEWDLGNTVAIYIRIWQPQPPQPISIPVSFA